MTPAPRKRFGQHFLNDEGVIQHILSAFGATPTQHVVEIGPGQGALTLPLLKQIKQLEVVELDRDLVLILEERANKIGTLTIHSADALAFNFAGLKQDERPLRIIGNLPYNISTPLIFHLLTFTASVQDMLFMLQKEVAHRLAAQADSDDYGRLSVMVQYYCEPTLLFDVSPDAFYPPPQVQSSIIRLVPFAQKPFMATDEALFASVVKQAFGQRRKTLRNSLKNTVDDRVWSQVGILPSLRAENLSVKDFVAISNALSESRS